MLGSWEKLAFKLDHYCFNHADFYKDYNLPK